MIENAYTLGEKMGLAVWCHDQAGPFQTIPYPGNSWQPQEHARRHPHEYFRNGTAKLMTLFHPASGHVIVKGVDSCPNNVLHPWLKGRLSIILEKLPSKSPMDPAQNCQQWMQWYEGLSIMPEIPDDLPPLRMLLIQDNLAGHKSYDWVRWCFEQGIALLYTPLGGSWLNMTESIQGIIERRALSGQHPETPEDIIASLEATAKGWNQDPTPFVWGGKRAARRDRARKRREQLAGSGACVLDIHSFGKRTRPYISKIRKFLNNADMHDN